MNILSITAGAAGMYCGSCLRDNALAAELKQQGHRVLLVPLYTPTLTDEENVSESKILFGGVSVYLQQYSPLFRRTPKWIDRLWDSTAALRLATRGSISTDPKLLGEMTVSMLRGEDGNQRKEFAKMVDWLRSEPAPDLVTLPNSLLIGLAEPMRRALGRPVCCTLQGEDLFLDGLQEPYRSESLELIRAAVAHVDGFAATTEFYAAAMCARLRIPDRKMHVLPLGLNLAGYDGPPLARERFTVGFLARVAPEKGLHILAEAYAIARLRLGLPESRLEAAGYMAADQRPYLERIERTLRASGFGAEFRYRGVLDRTQKIDFLRGLDVFSAPATYDEPKGISLLEAAAAGAPLLQPRRGAFPEIVANAGGILVEPESADRLAEGLVALWKDADRRKELGRRAAEGVRRNYAISRMASRAVEVYAAIVDGAHRRSLC
jgi:glycosyltransferase involved in cell wall biosynthesis